MIGPAGGMSNSNECSSNFLFLMDSPIVCTSSGDLQRRSLPNNSESQFAFSVKRNDNYACARVVAEEAKFKYDDRFEHTPSLSDIEREVQDEELKQQLERQWKTDFENTGVETKVCASLEDMKALEVMDETLTVVDAHYQVALQSKEVCCCRKD